MIRNYSITENPFVWGLRHKTLQETNQKCGFPLGSEPSALDRGFIPITNWAIDVYRLGRVIRLCFTIPLALLDVVLQIFQSIAYTFETLLTRIEMCLRAKDSESTLFGGFYIAWTISRLRLWTRDDYSYLAQDLGLVSTKYDLKTFEKGWRECLRSCSGMHRIRFSE